MNYWKRGSLLFQGDFSLQLWSSSLFRCEKFDVLFLSYMSLNLWKFKPSRYISCLVDESNQEKIRGPRGRLQVQALGYVNSSKVIFGDISQTEVCFPRRPN